MSKPTDDALTKIIQDLKGKKKLDIGLLSDADSPCVVHEFIPTGCLPLDRILGGGLPIGRMTEIYGGPSSGKTLVASQIVATAQTMQDVIVHYADSETTVSLGQMRRIGVDVDRLLYSSPDTVEEVFETMSDLINACNKTGQRLVFVWDSVAATSTKAELDKVDEKGFGETGYLNHARVISQSMRVITREIAKSQVALLFLNQTREKIGVMFGNKTATFGGKAISFHASIRVELTLFSKLKSSKGIIGILSKAYTEKNKIVPPYQTVQLPVYFGYGVNDAEACRIWLRDNGYITGASWQVLTLDGNEFRFQTSGWPEVYETNYEAISNVILNTGLDDSQEVGEAYDDGDGEG